MASDGICGYLKPDPVRFANGLGVVCDRRRSLKGSPQVFGRERKENGLLCAEAGKEARMEKPRGCVWDGVREQSFGVQADSSNRRVQVEGIHEQVVTEQKN